MLSSFVRSILEKYVKQYFKAHPNTKLVVVTGSVGKTSTKIAIATMLKEKYHVHCQEDNHNTTFSAPLAILGITYPNKIYNPFAWLSVFLQARRKVHEKSNVEVIVQELGSDRIGEIAHFGSYLKPDICVVTAVSSEHIEFFKTIENIAKEELAVANYSKLAIVNADDINQIYLKFIKNKNIYNYGIKKSFDYRFDNQSFSINNGYTGKYFAKNIIKPISVNIKVLGCHSLSSAIAATAVSLNMGLSVKDVQSGISKIKAVPGRMNVLCGSKNRTLIDDTYNSSPLAAECAIKTLYGLSSFSQRIVVLGDMNELGDTSDTEHEKIGKLCRPDKLDLVITVGAQAKKFIATAAKANGCNVVAFCDPKSAGRYVLDKAKEKSVILFKGSQGGIFLEEAVKINLASENDEKYLVRQSPAWMKQKELLFPNNK